MGKTLAGRKRKPNVQRDSKGRISRAGRAEDATSVAVEARIRHYGHQKVWDEDKNRFVTFTPKIAKEGEFGTPLGRLKKWGHISEIQYEAGQKFTEAIRAYLPISKAPRDTPKCVEASLVGGGVVNERETDERDKREARITADARRLILALTALDDRAFHKAQLNESRSHYAVVWHVCISEASEPKSIYELGLLREGLNELKRVLEKGR